MTVFQDHAYNVESFVLANDAIDIKPGSPVDILSLSKGIRCLVN